MSKKDINSIGNLSDSTTLNEKLSLLENENRLLFDLLIKSYKENELLTSGESRGRKVDLEILKNYEIKTDLEASATKIVQGHYGAASRVKRQLKYRLGNKVVLSTKSTLKMLMLPLSIFSEIKAFRMDLLTHKERSLPPIQSYKDCYEAERVKKHLSYRIGHVLVENSTTLWGCIKMPFLIRKELVEFRSESKKGVSKGR